MTKRLTIAVAALAVVATAAMAQPKTGPGDKFKQYRERLLGDYASYRGSVLDNYDKFLEGVWADYAAFKGETRDAAPKPRTIPEAPAAPAPAPAALPAPEPFEEPAPAPAPPMSAPAKADTPVKTGPAEAFTFNFYQIPVTLPAIEANLRQQLSSPADFAAQWRALASEGFVDGFAGAVRDVAGEYGFNDYLVFRMIMDYAAKRYPAVDPSSRMSLVHFILANMGYDARIGVAASGLTTIMLPLAQQVYARMFMNFDGVKYYIFAETDVTPEVIGGRVNTCSLPSDMDKGRNFSLLIPDGLNVPFRPHDFKLDFGGVTLAGEVNANLMPLLLHYPQMAPGDYAASVLMPGLRADLVAQLRRQLGDKPSLEAVNKLLAFVQNSLDYAVDEEQHGFEKPYFLEETLFYPQCDCEDRAIFYGYFLAKVLGVENHIINYPGHEAVAVTLSAPTNGDGYVYDGRKFTISDPTFLGAPTGMCMPTYRTTSPRVDYIYK